MSTKPVSSAVGEACLLQGLVFAKQFPNAAEPLRGLFVAEQVRATSDAVDWRVISAVPWVPRIAARLLGKPYVHGDDVFDGIPVSHPRYPVLPRRLLYSTVASSVAHCSRRVINDAIREHRARFVHAHALYPSGAAVRKLVAGTGIPYVVTIHGSDLYSNLARHSWRKELRETVSDAAAIVCVSSALARDAISLLGADPARTHVIPDTFDEVTFSLMSRERGDVHRLVCVGRLVDVKGHDLLLRAVASLVEDGMELSLDLVGDGPRRQALEALSDELRIKDRVRFLGALDQEGLARALYDADAFVLPSRREGFGVALIEALATGLPAVATRSGGPDDIVTEGNGVLVPAESVDDLAKGIYALIMQSDKYDAETIARDIRDRFGRQAVGGRLVDLYRDITALHSQRVGMVQHD